METNQINNNNNIISPLVCVDAESQILAGQVPQPKKRIDLDLTKLSESERLEFVENYNFSEGMLSYCHLKAGQDTEEGVIQWLQNSLKARIERLKEDFARTKARNTDKKVTRSGSIHLNKSGKDASSSYNAILCEKYEYEVWDDTSSFYVSSNRWESLYREILGADLITQQKLAKSRIAENKAAKKEAYDKAFAKATERLPAALEKFEAAAREEKEQEEKNAAALNAWAERNSPELAEAFRAGITEVHAIKAAYRKWFRDQHGLGTQNTDDFEEYSRADADMAEVNTWKSIRSKLPKGSQLKDNPNFYQVKSESDWNDEAEEHTIMEYQVLTDIGILIDCGEIVG